MKHSSRFGRPSTRVDRRHFIRAAGGAAVATALYAQGAPRGGTGKRLWDLEADVVVVGTGLASLSGAVTAANAGARVIVLEAGPIAGGTTARSTGGMWIPNNRFMRAAGLADPRDDAIRYMARYSFTDLYDASAEHYGIPAPSLRLIEAMYDNAAPGVELLEKLGAIETISDKEQYLGDNYAYDYWDHAPENKAPMGRLIFSKKLPQDTYPIFNGGAVIVQRMTQWLREHNVPFMFEHRVHKLVTNHQGAVIGVLAAADGRHVAIRSKRGVHFGSGGFLLNPELRRNHQRGPVFGGCCPLTNQGDFVYMATEAGAKLGNMQNGWRFQLVLDQVLQTPGLATDVWNLAGDSMILVNKYGKRVVNEKRPYSDRTEVHFIYDPNKNEWENLVLFKVYDQRVAELAAGIYPFPPLGSNAPYVLSSPTLEGLASVISERLKDYAEAIGGFKLDESFGLNLTDTVKRFNGFAEAGEDKDFSRGKYRYDVQITERTGGAKAFESNDKPNRTMYPLSAKGPYYAILIVAGSVDTNGGPVINENSQVMSVRNQPIPGLYGAGNCIASPSGRAYWGGGATLGLALTFGCIAGNHAANAAANEDT